jgi:D-threo-aldose 1-dehydrogenase
MKLKSEESAKHNQSVDFGSTGLKVTKLGLGTAPIAGLFTDVSPSDAEDVVNSALRAGIRYFDTAPLYGSGLAESRLGNALKDTPSSQLVVSSKVGRLLSSNAFDVKKSRSLEAPVVDFSEYAIRKSLEDSLLRMNRDHIDILYIHDPDNFVHEALTLAYPALQKMKNEGLVKAIGVGMNQSEVPFKFVQETEIDAVLVAGRYTLLDQGAADQLLPAALAKGVAIVVGGVYNSGILADPDNAPKYNYADAPVELVAKARKIRDFFAQWDVPLTAAAIQFPFRHAAVTTVLTGAKSVGELNANISAFNYPIPEECWQRFEALSF